MLTLPSLLRAAAAALLVAVAIDLASSPEDGASVLHAGPDQVEALARALVAPAPPERIVWDGPDGPTVATALLLAAGAGAPALTLPVGPLPRLRAIGPARPVAERAAVLDVEVRGAAGSSAVVGWKGAVGDGDSTVVALDSVGLARAGLGVRPARAGWQSWAVSTGADTVAVGAWTLPARTLRVHVLVGTPSAESRYALRALEEAGVEVEAGIELGRVGIEPTTADPTAADVVLLLRDPVLDATTRARLVAFVASGGGVIVAPADERSAPGEATSALLSSWGLGRDAEPGATLAPGDSVDWSLPAALSPLPSAPAPVRVATRTPRGGARAVGMVEGRAVALLSTPGVGRVAWTGISESWRWRMEGGALDAHRAWWRGLVEWAASGVREPIVAELPTAVVPGTVVTVRLRSVRRDDVSWPDSVALTRPDGRMERLPVVPERREPGAATPGATNPDAPRHARFLADARGVYRVSWDGGGEAGLLVDTTTPAPAPDAISLLALASGSSERPGHPLPPGGEQRADEGQAPARPWTPDGHVPPPTAIGYALVALLLAEWALRRRAGGP